MTDATASLQLDPRHLPIWRTISVLAITPTSRFLALHTTTRLESLYAKSFAASMRGASSLRTTSLLRAVVRIFRTSITSLSDATLRALAVSFQLHGSCDCGRKHASPCGPGRMDDVCAFQQAIERNVASPPVFHYRGVP